MCRLPLMANGYHSCKHIPYLTGKVTLFEVWSHRAEMRWGLWWEKNIYFYKFMNSSKSKEQLFHIFAFYASLFISRLALDFVSVLIFLSQNRLLSIKTLPHYLSTTAEIVRKVSTIILQLSSRIQQLFLYVLCHYLILRCTTYYFCLLRGKLFTFFWWLSDEWL